MSETVYMKSPICLVIILAMGETCFFCAWSLKTEEILGWDKGFGSSIGGSDALLGFIWAR